MHRSHLSQLSAISLAAGLMLSACSKDADIGKEAEASKANPNPTANPSPAAQKAEAAEAKPEETQSQPDDQRNTFYVPRRYQELCGLKTAKVKSLPAGKGKDQEVVTVPSAAVVEWPPQKAAFVSLGQGKYALRLITVGRQMEDSVTIVSGLRAGEDVVVAGGRRLQMLLQRQNSNFGGHGHPH